MCPASSCLRLQTSFPFSGRRLQGMLSQGTRANTWRSARLRNSSHAPAIQYSRSGECMAFFHEGSSSMSKSISVDPLERDKRKMSTEAKSEGMRSSGIKSWDSANGAYSERKMVYRSLGSARRWARRVDRLKGAGGVAGEGGGGGGEADRLGVRVEDDGRGGGTLESVVVLLFV